MTSRTRALKDILWVLALTGLVAAMFRLWYGLGATTNLSDAFPWGLWKVLNMVGGVALSTSGFTVGFLVYVLRLKRFQPFLKPAILIAFLGYGCSCAALLLDIGLPHRFWHPIFMWNINSFLFEVFWCVMLYFTVTAIELAPVVFERLRAEMIARALHSVAFGVVVIGISLSSLHHSSLGSLFLVTPQRLHPLWYSPWLPLLFIVSAMGAGLMVVVLAKILWARWYDPESVFGSHYGESTPLIRLTNGVATEIRTRRPEGLDMAAVRQLATIGASALGLFLLLKFLDLHIHGRWDALLAGTWESWLLVAELIFVAVLPILLVAVPWSRYSQVGIGAAAASAAFGLALNRLDVGIFGYVRDVGSLYVPSLIEWMVGLGVVAAAGLVFLFATEQLPIFGSRPGGMAARSGPQNLNFGSLRQLWNTALTDSLHRVTLLAVFVIPLSFVVMYPPFSADHASPRSVRPASGVDAKRRVLRLDGDNRGVMAIFAHADHQRRRGDSNSCVQCHHLSRPGDRSTACSRCHTRMNDPTELFEHAAHLVALATRDSLSGLHPTNFTCTACHAHDRPKTPSGAKACLECHRDDMCPTPVPGDQSDIAAACSFREAMHRTCVECHSRESESVNRPNLGDCRTCHESLRVRTLCDPVTASAPAEPQYFSP